jgi:hypothetical protein
VYLSASLMVIRVEGNTCKGKPVERRGRKARG